MVGDSYRHDIAGARSVGMKGILLRRSAPTAKTPRPGSVALPADVHVVHSLREVPSLVAVLEP
jgi:FMN phosphatase YigB (HAD superfamily)